MYTFVHRDLIAEKLEIARTLGLVTHYVVRPTEPAENGSLGVRVWRSPGTSEQAIRDYLARLLDGLISGQDIAVLSHGSAESETPRTERVDGPRIAPVSAAA
jgi:hypothetical protein